MSQNTIVWTDIPVTDLNRASAFYSKVLATSMALEKMDCAEFALLPRAREGGVSGCLSVCSDNKPSRTGVLIYLSVNGRLDDAVKAAQAGGGEVLQPKHQIGPYGFRAIIVDSEGNRIALHSETA